MADYQTIVENIRSVVLHNDTSDRESLHFLAESYALACKDVNARLLRCSQLIRSGNPSEAVRQADIEPDLLEAYALLDFTEKPQWNQFARQHQLPEAAALFDELAREVNDAYTTVNPLAPLLKKHRFLALARAPLPERMAVLREIVLMEPENLGWKTDLDAYEKTRFREIEQEIPKAVAAKNVPKMTQLVKEIDDHPWTHKPPEKLLQTLRKALQSESQRSTMHELKHLADKLNKAVAAEDATQALKFADRWHAFTEQLGGAVPMELSVEVQNALLWTDHQRRQRQRQRIFQEQQQTFRNDLLAGMAVEKMHEKYSQLETLAEELDEDIPEALTRLYTTQAEASAVRKTRVFHVFLVVLVLLGLTLAGGMVLAYRHFQHEQESQKIASTLERYLKQEEYDTAAQYIEEQKSKTPHLFDVPVVADVYAELQTAIDREKDRQVLFRESLQKVRDSLKTGTLDGLALSQARSRAKTEQEKYDLKTLEDQNRQKLAEEQRQKDFTLQRELDAISVDLRRLEPQRGRENDMAVIELNTLLQRATETRKIEGAGVKLLNERDAIIEQLTQWTIEIKQRNDFQKDLPLLTQTVADPQTYARTLQTLIKKYPNLEISKGFQTLHKEQPIWSTIAQWNEMVRILPPNETSAASNADFANKTVNRSSETIRMRSQKNREFLALWNKSSEQFKAFPDYNALARNIPYYRAEEEREDQGRSILLELEDEMRKLRSRPLWLYYSEKDKARYYLTGKPTTGGGHKYLVNSQDLERTVIIPGSVSLDTIQEAPHIQFAKLALRGLAQIDQPNGLSWTQTACILLQRLQDDTQMDPILRFRLLRSMIETFSTGDLSIHHGYDRHDSILSEEEPDLSANWLDPKSKDADYQRDLMSKVLSRLPSSQSAVDIALADEKAYKTRSISPLQRIGWAQKLPDGHWVCQTNMEELPDVELYTVRGTATEDGTHLLRFEPIRVMDSKQKTIASTPILLYGSPILMKGTVGK